MILAHKQVVTGYFAFSCGSNVAGKNEFVFQFTYLQSHLYVKYKTWKYNQ